MTRSCHHIDSVDCDNCRTARRGCLCPGAWWGIMPPPCPVHNPQTGRTFTTTTTNPEWWKQYADPTDNRSKETQ